MKIKSLLLALLVCSSILACKKGGQTENTPADSTVAATPAEATPPPPVVVEGLEGYQAALKNWLPPGGFTLKYEKLRIETTSNSYDIAFEAQDGRSVGIEIKRFTGQDLTRARTQPGYVRFTNLNDAPNDAREEYVTAKREEQVEGHKAFFVKYEPQGQRKGYEWLTLHTVGETHYTIRIHGGPKYGENADMADPEALGLAVLKHVLSIPVTN